MANGKALSSDNEESDEEQHQRSNPGYMGKPQIPVGKSNGSRHSVWEASENMGCDLK